MQIEQHRILKRLRRIKNILKVVIIYKMKGYPYYVAKKWGRKIHLDLVTDNGVSKSKKKWAHKHGFLSSSVKKYDINEDNYEKFFSDFDYYCLYPMNNAYEKWLRDRLTPYFIFRDFRDNLPKVYCNIIRREGKQVFIPINREDIIITSIDDLIRALKVKKSLMIFPSDTFYFKYNYKIEYIGTKIYVNGKEVTARRLKSLIKSLEMYYIVRDSVTTSRSIKKMFDFNEVEFIFIVSNSEKNKAEILCSYAEIEEPYNYGFDVEKRIKKSSKQILIDSANGAFEYISNGKKSLEMVPHWEQIVKQVCDMSEYVSEIEYMSLGFKITDSGIMLTQHGIMPKMPKKIPYDSKLNNYLKEKAEQKKEALKHNKLPLKKSIKKYILGFLNRHFFKRGFREYMLASWLNNVKDDFANTKTTTIKEKIWAWKRGFPSYRIAQYNLGSVTTNG